MTKSLKAPPKPEGEVGRMALKALLKHRNMLAPLEAVHREMGDVFQLPLPGFKSVFLVGPEANKFVLLTARDQLLWRPDDDPVTKLLRHGVLVVDGAEHDALREQMAPALHRTMLVNYVEAMTACTDDVIDKWSQSAQSFDMLVEMRRVALLILMQTLFAVDFAPDIERLWRAVLRTLAYISPGLWLVWPGMPRLGYKRALQQMDDYLYQIISLRRETQPWGDDLLGLLVSNPGLSDELIRDQLLTMLIAGHDTSTALLAWTLYLIGEHPHVQSRLRDEVDAVLGTDRPQFEDLRRLKYLDQVIKESLRLYPPIHLGQRRAAVDLEFNGYHIPAGTRALYSIYLSHRHPAYWENPTQFKPERFTPEQNRQRPANTFVPFGGGPRNCIGAAFGLVESKVVLARILQKFDLTLTGRKIHPHMGATLEPRPGVMMQAHSRS